MKAMLVDGNNILARAHHAATSSRKGMSAGGVETGSLHVFVTMLSKYVRLIGPTHLAVFWDAGHQMRDEIYPGYKANRAKHDEDGVDTSHFLLAKTFLTWAGVPHKSHRGWEADDLIAMAARQAQHEVAIVSGDKDLLQLIDKAYDSPSAPGALPATVQYRVPDDEPWTYERYCEHYGYAPSKAAMVHALVGDTSDGVPGVRGIGPKKAAKMLTEAGWNWDMLLASLGPERAAEASLMRSLVDLRECEYPEVLMRANSSVPRWEPTVLDSMLGDRLVEFCEQYALRSILDRLRDGSLWAQEPPKPVNDEGLFDGVEV